MRLQDKVAIVTGAGSGIGRGIAFMFAREGAKLVLADWSEASGSETTEMIRKQGGKAEFVKTDVSRERDIDKLVKTCLKEFNRVDILVNNAGIAKSSPIIEMNEKDWDEVIDVNLKSVFLGCRAVLPFMVKQGKGKIVSMASIAGLIGFAGSGAYCASKGGIIALTRALALEYAPNKINVNCIAPGIIKTAMTKDYLSDPNYSKSFLESTPYPRLGEPEDIAAAALYLASDESDFMTGQVIAVDGGWTAR